MPITSLDPGSPLTSQKDVIVGATGTCRRLFPAFSEIAEKAFASELPLRVPLVSPAAVGIWRQEDMVPGEVLQLREQQKTRREAAAKGATYDSSKEEINTAVNVVTPLMDPRRDPFGGSPEKLAAWLGIVLADHVTEHAAKVQAETGRRLAARTDVFVVAEIPYTAKMPDRTGMALTEQAPMLQGVVMIIFDR